jgi:hypothetical protein
MRKSEHNKAIDRCIQAGIAMGNICYNGKQQPDMPVRYRSSMAECSKEWDAALNEYIRTKNILKSKKRKVAA